MLKNSDEKIIADSPNSRSTMDVRGRIYLRDNISKIILHYGRFNNIYKYKLLNGINIHSSLNNLFNKFYDVPRISGYHRIKKYFGDYRIRTKKLIYNKQILKNSLSKDYGIVFNKNYTNNTIVDLSQFVNMYGFR